MENISDVYNKLKKICDVCWVGDEHDSTKQQVAAGRLGERFRAAGEQQHDTADRVNHGGAERGSERVRGEPHEPGHETP